MPGFEAWVFDPMDTGNIMEDHIVLFEVADGIYGVDINRVRTLLAPSPVYQVPHSPMCIKGFLNLEGQVVPVMDLRVRLGFPPVKMGDRTRFMVVEFGGQQLVLVVDAVTGLESISTQGNGGAEPAKQEVEFAPYEEIGILDDKVVRVLDLVGLARVA